MMPHPFAVPIDRIRRLTDSTVTRTRHDLQMTWQRDRDYYDRLWAKEILALMDAHDIAGLAARGWTPADYIPEESFSDGFSAGLTRCDGL